MKAGSFLKRIIIMLIVSVMMKIELLKVFQNGKLYF